MEFLLIWNILAGTNAFHLSGIGCNQMGMEVLEGLLVSLSQQRPLSRNQQTDPCPSRYIADPCLANKSDLNWVNPSQSTEPMSVGRCSADKTTWAKLQLLLAPGGNSL